MFDWVFVLPCGQVWFAGKGNATVVPLTGTEQVCIAGEAVPEEVFEVLWFVPVVVVLVCVFVTFEF